MRRVRKEFGTYYVFPGGGIEPGERGPEALRRELHEETGLRVRVGRRLMFGLTPTGKTHAYYLVTAPFRPVVMPKNAEERNPERIRVRGTTDPVWVPVSSLRELRILPPKVHRLILAGLKNGWPVRSIQIGTLWRSGRRPVSAGQKTKTRS